MSFTMRSAWHNDSNPACKAWCCAQAILVQELGSSRGGQGGAPQPGRGSQSAQAARHVLQAVHTFVALSQIQQVTCHIHH